MPQENPIKGSYSIDPCAFEDSDGTHYLIFGGTVGWTIAALPQQQGDRMR